MSPLRSTVRWVALTGLFLRELAMSVQDVIRTVIDPRRVGHSAIVAVPLDVRSDAGISLLANMITLTPGTTSLHVSDDRRVLYVHVMNASDQTVRMIKDGFERSVREVLP
ncbi:MAG: sodium:proton antiporter [Burkholderiaceae bacterium]|nr:sodium:proton antiporter [Burkholderiaceae bacterium]